MDISDIKSCIEQIIEKIKGDDGLKEKFTSDPAGTVRGLVGDAADNDTIPSSWRASSLRCRAESSAPSARRSPALSAVCSARRTRTRRRTSNPCHPKSALCFIQGAFFYLDA